MQDRIQRFQSMLNTQVDVAFVPISADLQYLTGIPRDVPSFGRVMHPGMWAEGAWIAPGHAPIVTLPRMTAIFGGLDNLDVEVRVLGDHDDPGALVRDIFRALNIPDKPRIAISDTGDAETPIQLQALFPDAVFSSATALLNPLRRVKTEDEIAMMRRAGEITEQAFAAVLGKLKHGMSELDIITEVDYQLRAHGSLGPSFPTSMYNAGPNHRLIFGGREARWQRPLIPPVSLLFDFGAVFEGYCYDFGRTVAFGAPPPDFVQVFDLVMAAQKAGMTALRTGETCSSVDAAARTLIANDGYGDAFRHRLGHGIGLDVHEAPFLTASDYTVLEEGMLFTVEPSITQFNHFSARVEDVIVVRDHGGEPLTRSFQNLHVID